MRFLHTADLHLGKALNDVSLIEDQREILGQIEQIALDNKVDAVLIAGDIYQSAAPSAEAMALFDGFVCRLQESGVRVFAISGNHDSHLRVSYLSSIAEKSGVYFSRVFDGTVQTIEMTDEYGKIDVHLMPFLKPSMVRPKYPDEEISNYEDAVAAVLRHSRLDKERRNVLVAHQFISGGETSDSEEQTVGGVDRVDAALFEGYDYVALGHLHAPQQAGRAAMRYSGSPLKYSFSEEKHHKSVVIADMREKGAVDVELVPLVPVHDVRQITGLGAGLLTHPRTEDYVWITVNDEEVSPDLRRMLLNVFPNMMKFSICNSKTKLDTDVLALESMENKSVLELFRDFYRLQNNGVEPSAAHLEEMEKVFEEAEKQA